MAYSINNYKCAGVVYKIGEMKKTGKGYPKREFFLEVPTSNSGMKKTEIFKFMVMGEETNSLDFYNEGDWLEVLFRIEGRFWKPPDKDESIHLGSNRPIDIHKGVNPFDKTDEPMSQDPDDLSPDHQAERTPNVKDWSDQKNAEEPKLFDDQGNLNNLDDLPF